MFLVCLYIHASLFSAVGQWLSAHTKLRRLALCELAE